MGSVTGDFFAGEEVEFQEWLASSALAAALPAPPPAAKIPNHNYSALQATQPASAQAGIAQANAPVLVAKNVSEVPPVAGGMPHIPRVGRPAPPVPQLVHAFPVVPVVSPLRGLNDAARHNVRQRAPDAALPDIGARHQRRRHTVQPNLPPQRVYIPCYWAEQGEQGLTHKMIGAYATANDAYRAAVRFLLNQCFVFEAPSEDDEAFAFAEDFLRGRISGPDAVEGLLEIVRNDASRTVDNYSGEFSYQLVVQVTVLGLQPELAFDIEVPEGLRSDSDTSRSSEMPASSNASESVEEISSD